MYGSPEDLIGTILSDTYEIERVVGEGTYGTVYAATHQRLNRKVAVKVLRVSDGDAFARFRREAEITSSLGSRFIAQVFDFNTMDNGQPYLVMELLYGEDLGSRLQSRGQLKLPEVLKICEQASMALSVAHSHDIVHRDLKPQNIFLSKTEDEGEVVKVIDFGISKVMSQTGSTATGQFIGTPLYMSPEQVRGQTDLVSARSDIYALAAVLYEALSGRPCYHGRTIFELVEKINGPAMPPLLSEKNPSIPEAVDLVLQAALAKTPDARPNSITDFYNQLSNAIRANVKSEAMTPAAAIMGTHALETMYATGMVATPLWRGRTGRDDELRFVAPEDGFFGGDNRHRILRLTADKTEFGIGSVPMIGDIQNHLVLPHRKVSRNSVRVIIREGRPQLRRESRCSVPVRVGLSILERGEERPLHHGQALAIGVVAGVFHDGRYVPTQVPAMAVDEQTGLLGREGLAWEIALAARLSDGRRMVIGMPVGEAAGDQGSACRAALALHGYDQALPVARFRHFVCALAKPEVDIAQLCDSAQGTAEAPMLFGHIPVGDSSDEAGARIDEALGALERIAASGLEPGLVDLTQHQLSIVDLPSFKRQAQEIMEAGGGIGLLAIEDQAQLAQLGGAVLSGLELELLQVAGRAGGSQAIFCRPAAGAIAFAGPDAPEPVARQIASEWHSRGPVRGEVLEVERSIAIDVVHLDELAVLDQHAVHLATGLGLGAGLEGLPLPIASTAQNALNAVTPVLRAQALTQVVYATWKFLAVSLGAMAVAARKTLPAPSVDANPATGTAAGDAIPAEGFAEPWRAHAKIAAKALADVPGRVGDLARALFEAGQPRRALQLADQHAESMSALLASAPTGSFASKDLPVLTDAVGDLLLMLRPLRGWGLASVVRVDRVDVFGDCETVHYVDYTGTYQQGATRQVTIIKDLRMGPFVYLTRFAEGIVVPLEPHMRRRPCPETGQEELYWASAPVSSPGAHRYTTVVHGHGLDDDVSDKQIPRAMRRS